jgi:DNA-binding CsgD family transcriptional regulator
MALISGRVDATELATTAQPPALTRRESEVLGLVAQGLTSKEVANQLFVSKRTVDFHLVSIYGKLEVRNRMQALREAQRRGLLSRLA